MRRNSRHYRFLIALTALWAITTIIIWRHASPKITARSTGENVSLNNSTDLEMQRLTSEVHERREAAEFWDIWNIRILSIAGFAALLLVITAIGVSRSNRELLRSSEELDRTKDRKLQSDLKAKDAEIGLAGTKAGKAIHDAAIANQRAGEANQKTEELRAQNLVTDAKLTEANRALEAEKTTRLELQNSIAPRATGWGEISATSFPTLKDFAGTQVLVEALTDAEARRAAQEIGNLMMFVNWKTVGVTSNPELFTGFFDGVTIVPQQSWPGSLLTMPPEQAAQERRLLDAAQALQDFLESRGWQSRMQRGLNVIGTVNPFGAIPKNTIKIIVGFKPSPFFEPDWVKDMNKHLKETREKLQERQRRTQPPQ